MNLSFTGIKTISRDSARFSGCDHYFHFNQYILPLSSSPREPHSPCKKPLIIQPGQSCSTCFFNVSLMTDNSHNIYAQVRGGVENQEKDTAETKALTTYPAHLRDAKYAVLLGEEENSNLRVVFWKDHVPPEIKYLNFTWKDFLSRFRNDFTTKLYALRESAD